jgi:hypothetical protein
MKLLGASAMIAHDVANLIVFAKASIQMFKETGDFEHLCLLEKELDDAVYYIPGVEDWHDNIMHCIQDEAARLAEWDLS